MCRSSRIPALLGAALLAAPPAHAATGGQLVLTQVDALPAMGPPGAPARPFGFPAPPFVPPLAPFPAGIAAPPRCPLVIRVGRGLAHAARSRVIYGRAGCV